VADGSPASSSPAGVPARRVDHFDVEEVRRSDCPGDDILCPGGGTAEADESGDDHRPIHDDHRASRSSWIAAMISSPVRWMP
jgi:hypothetical protein